MSLRKNNVNKNSRRHNSAARNPKGIILGEGGKMIRQLGTSARKDIEQFLGQKVFLELFVKVRPKWRDNDMMLKEYGYH